MGKLCLFFFISYFVKNCGEKKEKKGPGAKIANVEKQIAVSCANQVTVLAPTKRFDKPPKVCKHKNEKSHEPIANKK